jgi:hypothetical protein
MLLCSLVHKYQRFGGNCSLRLQARRKLSDILGRQEVDRGSERTNGSDVNGMWFCGTIEETAHYARWIRGSVGPWEGTITNFENYISGVYFPVKVHSKCKKTNSEFLQCYSCGGGPNFIIINRAFIYWRTPNWPILCARQHADLVYACPVRTISFSLWFHVVCSGVIELSGAFLLQACSNIRWLSETIHITWSTMKQCYPEDVTKTGD